MSEETAATPEPEKSPPELVEPDKTPDPSPTFPENWRELVAGDDEKLAERLKRLADPTALGKSYDEAQKKLAARDAVDWQTEDVAGLRKKLGVPESLDEYALKPPRPEMSESEQALFDTFREKMHGTNLTPQQGQALVDFYYDQVAKDEGALAERAVETTRANVQGLKQLWGADYTRNVTAAAMIMDRYIDGGQEGREQISKMVLADGTYLGDNPLFMKMMTKAGLDMLDDTDLDIALSGGESGIDPNDKLDELIRMQTTDPKKYMSKEVQDELKRVSEQVVRMRAERGRR